MKYTTTDNWHYKTIDGYYFMKGEVITDELYLGKYDSIDNWSIITEVDKEAIEKAREEAKKKEMEEEKEQEV